MRALEVEEAKEIEFERQIAPADAIVEPYCEVDVGDKSSQRVMKRTKTLIMTVD